MAGSDPEIFLSYAHADDEFPRYQSRDWEGARGWVECFYHALRKRVQQLRRGTEIWRDGDGGLRGASALTPAIERGIERAKVFVAVCSPAYAASEWCERELHLFESGAATRFGGLRVGTMLRVLKINKLPVTGASFVTRIPELADNVGYPFFRTADGAPLEYEPLLAGEPGIKFLSAVNNVACDIVTVLQGSAAIVPPSGITVYLADTSPDVAELRAKLKGELEQYGHTVLPHASDARGGDYVAKVRADLALAKLSVHVIGERSGAIPDAADGRTETEIQYDEAGAEAKTRQGFTRLTWLAPPAAVPEPAQAVFRERLRATDPALLVAPLEEVRSIVKGLLDPKPAQQAAIPAGDVRIVYLMFDAPDEEHARPVASWLYDQGFEVLKPARTGNLLKAHKINLRDSHGALVFYGEVNDEWLAVKLGDLRKTLGESRSKAHGIRGAVYLTDPPGDAKQEFRSRLFDVIPGFGRFRPELLEAFVESVRASGSS